MVVTMADKRPLVDTEVYALAEHMLDDLRVTILRKPTEDEIWELAGAIQQVCEDHFHDIGARETK